MPSLFRNLFDALISALGGGFDKPQPPLPAPQTGQAGRSPDAPVTATLCGVCGVMPAKPEYMNRYCDTDCIRRETEQDLADRMDAWHDQFQERFGDD